MTMTAEPRLYLQDVADLIGVRYDTLRSYRSRGSAEFPAPDGTVAQGQHNRPWWHRATIEQWQAARPGPGRHAASRARERAA